MSSKTNALDKNRSRETLKRILKYISQYKWSAILSLFLALITVALTLYSADSDRPRRGPHCLGRTCGFCRGKGNPYNNIGSSGCYVRIPMAYEPYQQHHHLPGCEGYPDQGL